MSNNKQSSVEFFLYEMFSLLGEFENKALPSYKIMDLFEQANAMQKQQAEHYATFITNCVINNLPTITFNDWINLHNNEQQ
jgi:hypothetical protein